MSKRVQRKALPPLAEDEVYIVFDACDCEDPGCYGKTDIAVITDPQLAAQAAEQRTKRYGNSARAELHWQKVKIQTKLGEF